MMANEALTKFTGEYLAPIGQSLDEGQSKKVDMQFSMIVQEANDKTGYMLLYGSNKSVGGYQINEALFNIRQFWWKRVWENAI